MTAKTFNFSLLFGWGLASAGGVAINPAWGAVGSGLLFIGLTLIVASLAGVRGD